VGSGFEGGLSCEAAMPGERVGPRFQFEGEPENPFKTDHCGW